jgi:hypothetical protein
MENLFSEANRTLSQVIRIFRRSSPLRYGVPVVFLVIWYLATGDLLSLLALIVALALGWLSAQEPPRY